MSTAQRRRATTTLIIGHESFGRVLEVGRNVPDTIKLGGYVVASVRRPGSSRYDQIGLQDFTTDDVQAEALFPGWLSKLLTTPIHGLERYDDMVRALDETETRSRCMSRSSRKSVDSRATAVLPRKGWSLDAT